MVETLRARVGRVIAGGAHALLDKLEDQAPEAMMQQAVRELDKVADEVRQELGRAAANRHLAQQQHADLNRRHTELSANIEQAIAQQREDLARAAVARQLDIEAQIPVLEATLGDLAKEEAELKGYADALQGKKRDMEDAISAYRASRARAESAASGAQGASSTQVKVDSATAAFDRIYQRQTGLTAAAHGASLQQTAKLQELDEMVRANKVEERLAQFKSRQG
jgi:phage shock protein A